METQTNYQANKTPKNWIKQTNHSENSQIWNYIWALYTNNNSMFDIALMCRYKNSTNILVIFWFVFSNLDWIHSWMKNSSCNYLQVKEKKPVFSHIIFHFYGNIKKVFSKKYLFKIRCNHNQIVAWKSTETTSQGNLRRSNLC